MTHTRIVRADSENPKQEYLKEAAAILNRGGLVLIPTETVYGIAANMLNNRAVERLYKIKQRPKDKPFSLHIDKKEKIEEFAVDISPGGYRLMDKFWPGPLTLVVRAKNQAGNIGVRMPDNEIAINIIGWAGVPVVCPSANISGKAPPKNFLDAIKDLEGLVDFAIDAGSTKLQVESSIVDLTAVPPEVLREGAIKKQEILNIVQEKTVLFVCTGNSCRSVMAKALLEKIMKEKNRDDIEVLSAGMIILAGMGATEATKELLKKDGMDVSGHVSQRVTEDMLKRSDMVLVMERLQEKAVLAMFPEVKNRLFLLKEFAKISDNGFDIPDPIGKPMEFYRSTYEMIKDAVERISNII